MKQRMEEKTGESSGRSSPPGGGITCEMAQRAIALAAMGSPDPGFYESAPSGGAAGHDLFANDPAAHPGFPDDPFAFIETAQGAGTTATAEIRRHEQDALTAHLSGCRSCQAEMAATTAFFRALAHEPGPEPSATLLARSRMQLDASLDSCGQAAPWTRFTQQLVFTAGRLRAAPALSSALLLTGLLAGGYGGYRAGHAAHNAEQSTLLLAPPAPEVPSVVADVSSISRDPATGLVEVRYDRLVPDVLTAPADDPSIRELLMAATENGTDPQVRNLSVNLLSGGCPPGAVCDGVPIRNALLHVLGSDKTPGYAARR